MDDARFDAFTRLLAARFPRRAAFGLAAALGPGPAAEAANKRRCPVCQRRKRRRCVPKPDDTVCGEYGWCAGGRCECGATDDGMPLRYCANAGACAQCCKDIDCGPCEECRGYPYGVCAEKGITSCDGSDPCVSRVCKPDAGQFVCETACCDAFAGEAACGPECCNALLGETCCDYGLCCTSNEECVAGRCEAKCADGRRRCGAGRVCCKPNEACRDGACRRRCPVGQVFCGACTEPVTCNFAADCLYSEPSADGCRCEYKARPYGTPCDRDCSFYNCGPAICDGAGACGCITFC